MSTAEQINDFWINDVGPKGWYQSTDQIDQDIRDRFMDDVIAAKQGDYNDWGCWPTASLALLILLDQFPRNLFRNDARSFSTDKKALCLAKKTIEKGFDWRTPEPERQFYYLPLMHSESLTDQDRCVRLLNSRMSGSGDGNIRHARVHREIIRKFGRFPYRNEALQRTTTPLEADFLKNDGYQEIMSTLSA